MWVELLDGLNEIKGVSIPLDSRVANTEQHH